MSYMRALYVLTAAGISGYLYRSISQNKSKNNVWKPKVIACSDTGCCDCNRHVQTSNCTPLASEEISLTLPNSVWVNKSIIMYSDYYVCYDTANLTPFYMVETMAKDNVAKAEHRHWELLTVERRVPLRCGCEVKQKGDTSHDVVVVAGQSQPGELFNVAQMTPCGVSTLNDFFFEYIKFLTERYEKEVFVWTGSLFIPQKQRDGKRSLLYQTVNNMKVPIPSHFYKVILCKNNNGYYRFECYKIINGPRATQGGPLKVFQIGRDQLEKEVGTPIFKNVTADKISDRQRHPDFKSTK